MCRLCTLLECGKVFCLGDGTEVKTWFWLVFFFPPLRQIAILNSRPHLLRLLLAAIGSTHVPVEVPVLHAFAIQDCVFSCVSGCACCTDV